MRKEQKDMPKMTEEEYDALDERLTKNPPEIDVMGVGFFSRNKQTISRKHIHYFVLCIGEFACQKTIPYTEAFNYLYKYKGIKFLIDCYDAEHLLSLDDAVDDLTIVCKNNGGAIE